MYTIKHLLPVKDSPSAVFQMLTEPEKIDLWWTLNCKGSPVLESKYTFHFGPGYDWEAKVIRLEKNEAFSWKMTKADKDWTGTELHFDLFKKDNHTQLAFTHQGWKWDNEHRSMTSYYWALYLRLLKRYLELGETTPYLERGH